VITAGRLRRFRGADGPIALFRELGYEMAPIDIDVEQWRRAGIEIGWNGDHRLRLLCRMRRFDLFLLEGPPPDGDCIRKFMLSYHSYNVITKSCLIYRNSNDYTISIYDISSAGELRRLDIDLRSPSAHALDRLNLLAAAADSLAMPRIFDRALDRESVTRRFFERFRAAVRNAASALAPQCPRESADDVDAEALLILSRMLFLSFVQEKGWLNGERRFLADRLHAALGTGDEFFATVLAPLFFGCLNTPIALRDDRSRALGRIPYLNGGLFDRTPFEVRHPDLHLPNELMQQIVEDLFERFDFSVDESDAAGAHVDPEMLGKVFESLMAEDERAASGSFYTPKAIVDALTRRAIVEWLTDGEALDLERVDGETAGRLLQRLENITVVDPACGSGAFLLSALGAIEDLAQTLLKCGAADPGGATQSSLRQRIVERSLFGVDLKPEAVRLCELRLWLAIVAPCDSAIEDVPPLPNLDRNILQGNSLLAPTDFLGDARGDIYRQWVYALRAQRDLLDRYRRASHDERPSLARLIRENDRRLAAELLSKAIDVDEAELQALSVTQRDLFGRVRPFDAIRCAELQRRIEASRRTLERVDDGALEFFAFDVHFAHVLARGGFEVVASNPPWVRNNRIEVRAKRMYADRYALFRPDAERAAFHQPDLSMVFFERAVRLAAPRGVVAMLMPAKVVNASYAGPLRRFAQECLTIVELDDWSDERRRWFDADTFPLGMVVRNEPPRDIRTISVRARESVYEVAQHELPVGTLSSEWALVPPDVGAILRRVRRAHAPLAEVLGRNAIMGVKTGDNRRFFLDAHAIDRGELVTHDGLRVPLAAVCRCVRGRDVRRWSAATAQWMLWPPASGWREPPPWLVAFAAARGAAPGSFRLSYVRPEHVGIKVAWKDLSRGMAAAVLPDVVHANGHAVPVVPNQTLYSLDCVSLDEAYAIAALLNSTIVDALLLAVAERAKDAHYRYFGRIVSRIPLPRLDEASRQWQMLVRASRQGHQGIDVSGEVDSIVSAAYGVTAAELRILQRFVSDALQRHAR